jgi:hypothetical protein
MALYASIGAGVVVVAVVVFLILSSNSDQKTSTGSSPGGSQSSSSQQSGSGTQAPSNPPASALGQSPSQPVTDYRSAGNFVVAFFSSDNLGTQNAWAGLTPAAQQVYGTFTAFQSYWSQHKPTQIKKATADKGSANADGSIDMNITLGDNLRPAFRVILVNGQYLIDADTKVFGP